MLHKILLMLALLTATLFGDSIPRATGAQPGSQFIGETFSQSLCFDNNGTAAGYQPEFKIVTPAGIKLTAATIAGNSTLVHQQTCTSSNCDVSNPIIGQPSILSPLDANESYYILGFPMGSFLPEWSEQCMDLTFELESSGDHVQLGNPLHIKTVAVFALGETVVDDGNYTYGSEYDLTVTPNVYTIDKYNNASESERATGAKYPIRSSIVLDIAHDENVTNLQIVDDLDGGMQFNSIVSDAGCTATQEPSTTSPGGTLELDCSSRIGAFSSNNIHVIYDGLTGTSRIAFNLSAQLVEDGEPSVVDGNTTVTVKFITTIDESYKVIDDQDYIAMGDVVENWNATVVCQ